MTIKSLKWPFACVYFSSVDIAASAFGRDFLINNQCGKQLVDIYIATLGEAPCGKSARLKKYNFFIKCMPLILEGL